MGKNHRNRSWRSQWIPERVSRTAVHKSSITARVSTSPTDPAKDRITLENTATLDLTRWDLGKLTEQAIKLCRRDLYWREGSQQARFEEAKHGPWRSWQDWRSRNAGNCKVQTMDRLDALFAKAVGVRLTYRDLCI